MFDSVDITLRRHQLEWGAGPGRFTEGSLSQMSCKLKRLGRPLALVHGKTVDAKGQLELYSRRETRAGWGGRLGWSPGVEPSSLPLLPLNLGRDSWPSALNPKMKSSGTPLPNQPRYQLTAVTPDAPQVTCDIFMANIQLLQGNLAGVTLCTRADIFTSCWQPPHAPASLNVVGINNRSPANIYEG